MQRPIPRGVRLKAHAGSPLMQSAPHWTTTASGQYADQILLAMLVNNTKNTFQQNNLRFGIDHHHKQKGWLRVLMYFMCSCSHFQYSECHTPTTIVTSATVLFPCGVGRVASHLLSKLVGLYHRVIYVGGPLEGARSTTTGWHTNTHTISVPSLILFVNCNVFYKTEVRFLFNIL